MASESERVVLSQLPESRVKLSWTVRSRPSCVAGPGGLSLKLLSMPAGPTAQSVFSAQKIMKSCCHVVLLILIEFSEVSLAATTCASVSGSPLPSTDACILGQTVLCDQTTWYQQVCWVDGQLCPRPSQPTDPILGVNGHFISASISWKGTGGNSVEFEIMSTWRYSFLWPTQDPNIYTGPCGFPGVGDMVPIVGISADSSILYGQQSAPGIAAQKLYSGIYQS